MRSADAPQLPYKHPAFPVNVLPICPRPYQKEAAHSWLTRVARVYNLNPERLVGILGLVPFEPGSRRYLAVSSFSACPNRQARKRWCGNAQNACFVGFSRSSGAQTGPTRSVQNRSFFAHFLLKGVLNWFGRPYWRRAQTSAAGGSYSDTPAQGCAACGGLSNRANAGA